jgi:seryl-tRNA synthetase
MYDLKWIRESPEGFDAGLTRRGLAPRSAEVLDLDARHRALLTRLQEMQARRNEASRAIGEAKRKDEDAEALLAEVAGLKDQLSDAEDQAYYLVTSPKAAERPDVTAFRAWLRQEAAGRLDPKGSASV